MAFTEKQKKKNREWDRKNMRSLSCRVRTNEAEIFKEYCYANGKRPGGVLKEYVLNCNKKYCGSKNNNIN